MSDNYDEYCEIPYEDEIYKSESCPLEIRLKRVCYACPEAYEAYIDHTIVSYMRLRHGYFYVECPDAGGKMVYEAEPADSDGIFNEADRELHLGNGIKKIFEWYIQTKNMSKWLDTMPPYQLWTDQERMLFKLKFMG